MRDPGHGPTAWPQLMPVAWKVAPARWPFERLDVMVVQNFAPSAHPAGWRSLPDGLSPRRLVLLRLDPKAHGNALGIGRADIITADLYQAIDVDATYRAALAVGALRAVKIPLVAGSDRDAIGLALVSSRPRDPAHARVVIRRDWTRAQHFLISESLWHGPVTDALERRGSFAPPAFDHDEQFLWPLRDPD
jgi:hypothetical protein